MLLAGRETGAWQQLEQAYWLHHTQEPSGDRQAQLLDATVLTQAPGRALRSRAAGLALCWAHCPAMRAQPATVRLIAVTLAAHRSPEVPAALPILPTWPASAPFPKRASGRKWRVWSPSVRWLPGRLTRLLESCSGGTAGTDAFEVAVEPTQTRSARRPIGSTARWAEIGHVRARPGGFRRRDATGSRSASAAFFPRTINWACNDVRWSSARSGPGPILSCLPLGRRSTPKPCSARKRARVLVRSRP